MQNIFLFYFSACTAAHESIRMHTIEILNNKTIHVRFRF